LKTTPHNEASLAVRLIAGDAQAFDALYFKYYHSVFDNALALLKDRQQAEDIVQEVFLTLWEKRNTIRHLENIGGWLYVISTNKSMNTLRQKLRARLRIQTPESMTHIPYVPDNAETYEEQMTALEKAIRTLPPQQRKVFELCKLEGKTYEETARTLDISQNTVKTHMQLAIGKIKETAVLGSACLFVASLTSL
jgi:RNA polymerase sigma-70 factor (family 1)